jgi:hypothetical protein
MINLVMFHSGPLPNYLEYTFKQIRIFNPEIKIYFITDDVHLANPLFINFGIEPVNKNQYYINKISKFKAHYEHSHFWTISTIRFMYIEEFMRRRRLSDVYLFENDIMLYFSLQEHHDKFLSFYPNMAITTGGIDKSMTGFMFLKNCKAVASMTDFFVSSIKLGTKWLVKKYKMDMVNEMTLMKAYSKEKGLRQLSNLPILPFGEFSEHFNDFNSIFDPASWGQFVGGLVDKCVPGAKPKDHYIGQLLIANPEYTVIWKRDNYSRKIPYFKYKDQEVKINNLHIHSKELYKYMSL